MNQKPTREMVRATLQEIFRDVLANDTLVLSDDMRKGAPYEWDSLAQMTIIDQVERHYRIRFALAEIDQFNGVADLLTATEKKIGSIITP